MERDDVICAKVQSPRTLKRAALHDHQHANRFRLSRDLICVMIPQQLRPMVSLP